MQPVGPYRFTEALGVCQVGTAWWAIDGQDRLVTVAVLDGAAATDQPWREAFANAANAMALTSGGQRYVNADFAAAKPWVAYPSEEGMGAQRLFQTLGMDLHPAEAEAEVLIPETGAVAGPPQPVSGVPISGTPSPTSGAPLPWAMHAAVPHQVSVPPHQVSAPPQQVSPAPQGEHPQPVSVPPHDPFAAPARRITPSEPKPRRTGLWLGVAALVLVVLAGGGAAFVWLGKDDPDRPKTPGSSTTALPPEQKTPPQSPGLEPPTAGDWPKEWPKFRPGDSVRTFSNLESLGFALKVPAEWDCTPAGRAQGFVKYNCGVSNAQQQIGGELIVRDCALPCDVARQTALRQEEDAWGLQWMRGGQFVSYADSSRLQLDGERRYGLVIVAYWRGGDSGQIDRQIVFRMTAPIDGAGRLRRVANHLRDTLIF